MRDVPLIGVVGGGARHLHAEAIPLGGGDCTNPDCMLRQADVADWQEA